jgi:hypothetical protein
MLAGRDQAAVGIQVDDLKTVLLVNSRIVGADGLVERGWLSIQNGKSTASAPGHLQPATPVP